MVIKRPKSKGMNRSIPRHRKISPVQRLSMARNQASTIAHKALGEVAHLNPKPAARAARADPNSPFKAATISGGRVTFIGNRGTRRESIQKRQWPRTQ